ncbi:hypothetical protein AKJ16_DCAP00450 [Drosera capensis]
MDPESSLSSRDSTEPEHKPKPSIFESSRAQTKHCVRVSVRLGSFTPLILTPQTQIWKTRQVVDLDPPGGWYTVSSSSSLFLSHFLLSLRGLDSPSRAGPLTSPSIIHHIFIFTHIKSLSPSSLFSATIDTRKSAGLDTAKKRIEAAANGSDSMSKKRTRIPVVIRRESVRSVHRFAYLHSTRMEA